MVPTAPKPAGAGPAATPSGCHRAARREHPRRTDVSLDVINGTRYDLGVLRSFRDKDTEHVWHRQRVQKLDGNTQRTALRKLLILDAADRLNDLRVPPGNRLEKLKGNRANSYTIRINQRWRIWFRWTAAGPEDVEIVAYH